MKQGRRRSDPPPFLFWTDGQSKPEQILDMLASLVRGLHGWFSAPETPRDYGNDGERDSPIFSIVFFDNDNRSHV